MPSSLVSVTNFSKFLLYSSLSNSWASSGVEPEDLVGPGTGEGLTDLTAVSVILHLDDHPAFGVEGGLSDTALGINADIDKFTGDGYVCTDCSVAFGDGRVPTFPLEKVSEGLCRGVAEGAAGEAEVTLPAP